MQPTSDTQKRQKHDISQLKYKNIDNSVLISSIVGSRVGRSHLICFELFAIPSDIQQSFGFPTVIELLFLHFPLLFKKNPAQFPLFQQCFIRATWSMNILTLNKDLNASFCLHFLIRVERHEMVIPVAPEENDLSFIEIISSHASRLLLLPKPLLFTKKTTPHCGRWSRTLGRHLV